VDRERGKKKTPQRVIDTRGKGSTIVHRKRSGRRWGCFFKRIEGRRGGKRRQTADAADMKVEGFADGKIRTLHFEKREEEGKEK